MTGPRDDMSPFESVTYFFDEAADAVEMDDQTRAVLSGTYREIRVQIPLRRDDGSVQTLYGYRVQHNEARGPYKGGVRYHPTANLDEVRAGHPQRESLGWLRHRHLRGGHLVVPRLRSQRRHVP